MVDHPRSAIVGISLILKFGLDPIYNFGDIAIFIFCRFGLKLPIQYSRLSLGDFGGIFPPNYVTQRPKPQKALPYAETRDCNRISGRFSIPKFQDYERPYPGISGLENSLTD